MGITILKLLTTWLHSNITPFSRVIVPVVEFTGVNTLYTVSLFYAITFFLKVT